MAFTLVHFRHYYKLKMHALHGLKQVL